MTHPYVLTQRDLIERPHPPGHPNTTHRDEQIHQNKPNRGVFPPSIDYPNMINRINNIIHQNSGNVDKYDTIRNTL